MKYSEEFIQLVKKEQPNYIGIGNPCAKILIIGKECAINTDTPKGMEQYNREIRDNIQAWKNNIDNDYSNIKEIDNPLYLYKGQKFTINKGKENGGTSATWYNYQKLINLLTREQNGTIDFHERCFISELSEVCGSYSHCISKEKKAESIRKRIELFNDPFFQMFPIIIIAAGHYPKLFNVDLQETFKVKYLPPTRTIDDKKRYWINIHQGTTDTPKLLIHTNQLSMISNELLNNIAAICKEFIEKNKIDLGNKQSYEMP